MSSEAIAAIAANMPSPIQEPSLQPLGATPASAGALQSAAPAGFGDMVTQGLANVNRDLMASQVGLQQLALGQVQNLHQTMVQLEQSRLSFQLFMQVRTRLLEAYQDVMKMQV